MDGKRLLACVTGSVDAEWLLRNEYLATENRILRHQLRGRLRLSDAERISLAMWKNGSPPENSKLASISTGDEPPMPA